MYSVTVENIYWHKVNFKKEFNELCVQNSMGSGRNGFSEWKHSLIIKIKGVAMYTKKNSRKYGKAPLEQMKQILEPIFSYKNRDTKDC